MAKGRDSKKNVKKEDAKTPKEKKEEKRLKKSKQNYLIVGKTKSNNHSRNIVFNLNK